MFRLFHSVSCFTDKTTETRETGETTETLKQYEIIISEI